MLHGSYALGIQSPNVRAWARGVQSPPKSKVFRFHYHSQKVIGSLGMGHLYQNHSITSFYGEFFGSAAVISTRRMWGFGSWKAAIGRGANRQGPYPFRLQKPRETFLNVGYHLRVRVRGDNVSLFYPDSWGDTPILTSIFQMRWNHQLETVVSNFAVEFLTSIKST